MAERQGDWIQTFSGKAYYPMDPRVEDISIQDIAHGLSNMCRYGGQCSQFYSVAEHSVHVARWVAHKYRQGPQYVLYALLHDASEAYLVDVPRPIKKYLANYKEIEKLNQDMILDKYGLLHQSWEPQWGTILHCADNEVMMAEKSVLLGNSPEGMSWGYDAVAAAQIGIHCFDPQRAKRWFLAEFNQLWEKVNA